MIDADITVAAPPNLPQAPSSGLLVRALPVVMSVATLGVLAAVSWSGSAVARNPIFLAFPVLMVASLVVTAMTGRGGRAEIDADRADYLAYLSRLRESVTEIAVA